MLHERAMCQALRSVFHTHGLSDVPRTLRRKGGQHLLSSMETLRSSEVNQLAKNHGINSG